MKLIIEKPEWLLEIKTLAKTPQLPLEIAKGLIDFVEAPEKFVSFKTDDNGAAVASECVVSLDPSERLLSLMSALRARDSNFSIIEHSESLP